MNIIYGGEVDVRTEYGALNGQEGAVFLTDEDDDLDITFEDIDTALEWATELMTQLRSLEAQQ